MTVPTTGEVVAALSGMIVALGPVVSLWARDWVRRHKRGGKRAGRAADR